MDYTKITKYDIATIDGVIKYANKFLYNIKNLDLRLQEDKTKIENFWLNIEKFFINVKEKNPQFFEESIVNFSFNILNYAIQIYSENYMVFMDGFFRFINNNQFQEIKPLLKNNQLKINTILKNLLEKEKISLIKNFIDIFLDDEKKVIHYIYDGDIIFIKQLLENNKILSFHFLLEEFKGFDENKIQIEFLKNQLIQEKYLQYIFPNHIFLSELEKKEEKEKSYYVENIMNNEQISLSEKIKFINYFIPNENIPFEMLFFILKNVALKKIKKEEIKILEVKDEKIIEQWSFKILKNTLAKTNTFMINNKEEKMITWSNSIEIYLKNWFEKDEIIIMMLKLITERKGNDELLILFTDYYKKELEKHKEILVKDMLGMENILEYTISYIIHQNDLYLLKDNQELKKMIINKKWTKIFFDLYKNDKIDEDWINMLYYDYNRKEIKDNVWFRFSDFKEKLLEKITANQSKEEIFNSFFLTNTTLKQETFTKYKKLLENSNFKFIKTLEEDFKYFKYLLENTALSFLIDEKEKNNILKINKWNKLFHKKLPVQIIYENNQCYFSYELKNELEEKTNVNNQTKVEKKENLDIFKNLLDNIIDKAKKDFIQFNELINQEVPFNIEFKIRSEHLFIEQLDFLKKLKKIEDLIQLEDIYLLQNNLSKYLIQCSQTYGKALQKNEMAKNNHMDDKAEKIHAEALKQIYLLEKEFELVKKNIINNMSDAHLNEMKVNTKVLETKNQEIENTSVLEIGNKTKLKIG